MCIYVLQFTQYEGLKNISVVDIRKGNKIITEILRGNSAND